MTNHARLYATVLMLFSVAGLVVSVTDWRSGQPVRFLCFAAVAALLALLRARMTAVSGQTSFTVLFVLFGTLQLELPEVLILGAVCVMIESVWKPGRINLFETCFAVMAMAVSAAAAFRASSFVLGLGIPSAASLMVATVVLFFLQTTMAAAVASQNDRRGCIAVWRSDYVPTAAYYVGSGVVAWLFSLLADAAGWPVALVGLPALYLLYRTYRLHRGRADDRKDHEAELEALHMRTIEALALAIEAKDTTTGDHLRRVQVYAVELGRELGMTSEELTALRAAAVLHDIGKLAVPEYIVSKPGRLTPAEFEKMKVHPVVGAEILEHVQFPYPVVPIVRAHHEKWNGTGYPFGLAGEQIPLGARILAAVDALDALSSDRQYRRALPLDEALEKVKEDSGRAFDPAVVTILEQKYVELEAKAQKADKIKFKLSNDLKIQNGHSPAAGFESIGAASAFVGTGASGDPLLAIGQIRNELQTLLDNGIEGRRLLLEEFCALFAVRLRRVVPFHALVLWVVDEDKLVPAYLQGYDQRFFAALRIPVGQGLSGWVVENQKAIVNGNPSVESGYLNNPNLLCSMLSALAVPLEGSEGVFGVLSLYLEERDAFTRDHVRVVESLTPRVATAVAELAPRRHLGPLPGRNNRMTTDAMLILRHIESELSRARRLNLPLGVIICSLCGSKGASEAETEIALRTMMGVMREGSNDHELLARLSDTEMVLIVPGGGLRDMRARAARLLRTPFTSGAFYVAAGASSFPDHGPGSEQLLATAEKALLGSRTEISAAIADGAHPGRLAHWLQ